MTKAVNLVLIILVLGVFCVPGIFAQTTEISYQGSLKDNGQPANGNYDIEFRLFAAEVGGAVIGTEIFLSPVVVTDGIFSVKLDFGANGFPGPDRYLEIAVKPSGGGSLVTLAPRQKIASTPYAVQSLQANTATTAMIASNAMALGGIGASQYILTSDPRLSDPRPPTGGSGSYIQNTISPQTSSNFNISGTGTAGTFTANTRYNFGSQHLISAAGTDNIFAGAMSGLLNTGLNNAFFGARAGQENKQGTENSFFGAYAGQNNVGGSNNSFFGYFAGNGTTSGNENSFFGNRAGQVNTSGAFNSFFGTFSGLFNASGSENSFFGNQAGYQNTVGNRNSFLGSSAGHQNATGEDNAFVGTSAGRQNLSGNNNSFLGSLAGLANVEGNNNSFFGARAGHDNTASNNSFFGADAGRFSISGANNTFIGRNAGGTNTFGELNVFVGVNAGAGNTLGRMNTIVGAEANVLGSNLQYATAIGAEAVVNSSNTVVLGRPADSVRVPGSMSVLGSLNVLGTLTASTLSFQSSNLTGVVGTANGGTGLNSPGMNGYFLRSNGTSWISAPLLASELPSGAANYVQNSLVQQGSTNFNISGNGTAGGTFSGNAVNSSTQYNIGGVRVLAAAGSNLFTGLNAGTANTTGTSNSFVGSSAGTANAGGSSNSYFGSGSGLNSSTGSNNTFSGASSGSGNTTGGNNSFFGINAGQTNTIGSNNTVLGANSNVGSSNLAYATAIGADAVVSTNNTVVLGRTVDMVRVPGNLQVDGNLIANGFPVQASNLLGTVAVGNGGTGMASSGSAGNYLRSNGSIWQSSAIAAGDIPAGSINYIQNGFGVQSGANFNISGAGSVGGVFTAHSISSGTQYNINGTRVLSNAGSTNIFVGVGTATTGSGNSFFGFGAGAANVTGVSNTIIGSNADLGTGNLTFATAIGSGATVSNSNSVVLGRSADTVRIPGNIVVTGSVTAPNLSVDGANVSGVVAAANGGTGLASPGTASNFLRSTGTGWQSQGLAAADVPTGSTHYIQNGAAVQSGAGFNIGGSGIIGGNLTVGGTISGTISVPAANVTGVLTAAQGGTGLGLSTGTNFLRGNGSGGWTPGTLSASDIPTGSSSYVQISPAGPQAGSFNLTGTGAVGGSMTIGGPLSVNGAITGSFTIPAANILGPIPIASGGTGMTSAGTSGHFVKSNGTGFTTAALTAAEIPGGSDNYIQNTTSPQTGNFAVTGSGTVGTNLSVGGSMTVTGGLTVNGPFTGSFSVPATNVDGVLLPVQGGTGLSLSTGNHFLRGDGAGAWVSSALLPADVPAGSSSYIQNGISQQTLSNFNISGSGTVGGTVTGSVVNAVTQYNINGNRVFATNGSSNIFAGEGAGNTGSSNAFFGASAGNANTSGSSNTIIGADADVASGNLTNATAIGANATVSQSNSLVLGSVNGVNGGTDTSVGIGTTAPKAKLEVRDGNILLGTPGQGVILKSPDGSVCRLLSLDNSGAFVSPIVPCP